MSRFKLLVKLKSPNIQYTLVHLQKVLCRNLTKDCLMTDVTKKKRRSGVKKVTIVGTGSVGAAAAFTILAKNVTGEICLLDADENKSSGEMMDFLQGAAYLNNPKITASSDFAKTANSSICIVTAGVRGKADENRLNLLQRNVDLFKSIIPNLVKHSPKTRLIIVSNPVDVMTYVSWKISGFPINRVLGTGTTLDSARFRLFIAQRLGIAPTSVHALIIGEHGDSSVPVWSSVNVAGEQLVKINPKIGSKDDEEKWSDLHKEVVQAAYKIIKQKGYTSWAIGVVVSAVTSAILQDSNQVLPVATSACGFHGIEKDVFLSLPCVLNSNGVQAVINQHLTPKELELLQKSAKALGEAQDNVKI